MTSLSSSNSLESNDDGSNNNNNNITNLEDLLNNNTINDDDLPVDEIYEGKVDLEGSITRKLSLDYDYDEDGYFASKTRFIKKCLYILGVLIKWTFNCWIDMFSFILVQYQVIYDFLGYAFFKEVSPTQNQGENTDFFIFPVVRI